MHMAKSGHEPEIMTPLLGTVEFVGTAEREPAGFSPEQITIGFNILDPKAIREDTLSFIIDAVSGKNYKAMIDYLRSLSVEKQNVFKRKLPWFNLGSFEGSRSNANWKYGIGVVLDYDHLRYPPSYYKKYVLSKLTFCQIAFTSPRGKGLKVIILWDRIVTDEAEQRELFLWVKDMYDRALNETSDNTPDPARATFFSWDEHIYVNLFANRLPVDKALHIIRYRERKAMAKKLRKYVLREKKNGRESITANEETEQVSCPPTRDKGRGASGVISFDEDFERARYVVSNLAQIRFDHSDWVKCGLALYAGFGERGKELWDMFLHNPHYTDTQKDLDVRWRSFASVRNVKLGSLYFVGGKYGIK